MAVSGVIHAAMCCRKMRRNNFAQLILVIDSHTVVLNHPVAMLLDVCSWLCLHLAYWYWCSEPRANKACQNIYGAGEVCGI
jgi:hypothetical protein